PLARPGKHFKGLTRFRKRGDGPNYRLYVPVIDEPGYCRELFRVAFYDEKDSFHIRTRGRHVELFSGGRDHRSATVQHLRRAVLHIVRDAIERELCIPDLLVKALLLVVDDLVGAERFHQVQAFGTTGSDDLRPAPAAYLNGQASDSPRSAMDK